MRHRCLRAAKESFREFVILQYISVNFVALITIQPQTRKVLKAQVAIVVNLCASCIRLQLCGAPRVIREKLNRGINADFLERFLHGGIFRLVQPGLPFVHIEVRGFDCAQQDGVVSAAFVCVAPDDPVWEHLEE